MFFFCSYYNVLSIFGLKRHYVNNKSDKLTGTWTTLTLTKLLRQMSARGSLLRVSILDNNAYVWQVEHLTGLNKF